MLDRCLKLLAVYCAVAFLLSGCWSASDVEEKIYVKALGIDIEGGQFIVYGQMMDFGNIAKTESGSGTEIVNYIGQGRGRTLNMAANDLYRSAQLTVAWGHVSAIVITERAMKAKGFDLIEMINRYPEIRYNSWLYLTKDSLEEVFTADSLFYLPSLYNILHSPKNNYEQNSILPPIELFKYIARYNEPDLTSYIPVIGMNRTQWRENDAKLSLLTISGAYFESSSGIQKIISRPRLDGYQWMQKETQRAPLAVIKDGIHYTNLNMGRPKVKIKPIVQGNSVVFDVTVKLVGAMYEYNEPIPYEEMVDLAEQLVADQIKQVYLRAVNDGIDIFDFGRALRLSDAAAWKRLTDNGVRLIVDSDSIRKLEVKIRIPYNGKYKRTVT